MVVGHNGGQWPSSEPKSKASLRESKGPTLDWLKGSWVVQKGRTSEWGERCWGCSTCEWFVANFCQNRHYQDHSTSGGDKPEGHTIMVTGINPYRPVDSNSRVESTTRLTISDIPMHLPAAELEDALSQVGCDIRSKVLYEMARDERGKLSRFQTGNRFVYMIVSETSLLKTFRMGIFNPRLFYKEQLHTSTRKCFKCLQSGHIVWECINEEVCRTCFGTGHKTKDPVCTLGLPETTHPHPHPGALCWPACDPCQPSQPAKPSVPKLRSSHPGQVSCRQPPWLANQLQASQPWAWWQRQASSKLWQQWQGAIFPTNTKHWEPRQQAWAAWPSEHRTDRGSRVGPRVEGFLSLGLALIPWWSGSVHGLILLDLTISNGDKKFNCQHQRTWQPQ